MEFKNITIDDFEIFKSFKRDGELSCESSFVTQLIWGQYYHSTFATADDVLFLKSAGDGNDIFSLPFGNLEKGVNMLFDENGGPVSFWAQEGERFEKFKAAFGELYDFYEERDASDYIYNRSDLAELAGKKYHSKRNHISAFSKKHDWSYRKFDFDNIALVKGCSEQWYSENDLLHSKHLSYERSRVNYLLDNFSALPIIGAAIFCDGRAVAFTVASEINGNVLDIHIEKALRDYSEAYTVINREFVREEGCKYQFINREDDMGKEGLRKAKLSYKPTRLLKKYSCVPR